MRVQEAAVRSLFVQMGSPGAANAKKATVPALNKRLAGFKQWVEEGDAKQPTGEVELALHGAILDALASGKVVSVDDGSNSNGEDTTVERNGSTKTNGKTKPGKSGGKKTSTQAVADLKAKGKKPSGGGGKSKGEVDRFGSFVGKQGAVINAAMNNKPKTVEQVAKEVGLTEKRVQLHLNAMVQRGHFSKSDKGFVVK